MILPFWPSSGGPVEGAARLAAPTGRSGEPSRTPYPNTQGALTSRGHRPSDCPEGFFTRGWCSSAACHAFEAVDEAGHDELGESLLKSHSRRGRLRGPDRLLIHLPHACNGMIPVQPLDGLAGGATQPDAERIVRKDGAGGADGFVQVSGRIQQAGLA